MTDRDTTTTGRLRIGRWVPITSPAGPPAAPRSPFRTDPTDVGARSAFSPGQLQPPFPGNNRRFVIPWSVVIPVAAITLLVAVAVANLPNRTGQGLMLPPPSLALPEPGSPSAPGSDPGAASVPGSESAAPSPPVRPSATAARRTAPAAPPRPPKLAGSLLTGKGGRCVENAGGQVRLAVCNAGAANQRWTTPGDGTIRSLGGCLDTEDSGTSNRTRVVVAFCDGTSSQDWDLRGDSTIRNDRSDKCLDVYEGFTDPGTPLIIFSCHGESNQQWLFL